MNKESSNTNTYPNKGANIYK